MPESVDLDPEHLAGPLELVEIPLETPESVLHLPKGLLDLTQPAGHRRQLLLGIGEGVPSVSRLHPRGHRLQHRRRGLEQTGLPADPSGGHSSGLHVVDQIGERP